MLGMIEGAIIGAVVGLVFSLIMILKRKGLRKELLRLLKGPGPDAARQYLDKKIQPLTKIKLNQILDQRERMAALTLLDDRDALEQEIAGHLGPLTAVVQVNAIALLGLALRAEDPSEPAQRLEQLATQVEQEGGRTLKLVKKKTRALAVLAQALGGERIPSDVRLTLESFSGDGGMVQLLVWQATAVALDKLEQTQQASDLRQKVRSFTDAFEG
jgi:hypothetical protein